MLNREKSCSVILAAGGSGSRFGGEINKILLPLRGKPVIAHSLEVFLEHPAVREIVIPCRCGADRPDANRSTLLCRAAVKSWS